MLVPRPRLLLGSSSNATAASSSPATNRSILGAEDQGERPSRPVASEDVASSRLPSPRHLWERALRPKAEVDEVSARVKGWLKSGGAELGSWPRVT